MAKAYVSGKVAPSATALATLNEMKYGRAERRPLREVLWPEAQRVFRIQQDEGFGYFSDGQVLWPDNVRPLYLREQHAPKEEPRPSIPGAAIGPQQRYFDTNGFWFPPTLAAAEGESDSSLAAWSFPVLSPASIRLVGPYTFARVSQYPGMSDIEVAERYKAHLQKVVDGLPHALIEISEPSIGADASQGQVRWELLTAAQLPPIEGKVLLFHPGRLDFNDSIVLPDGYDGIVIDATETAGVGGSEPHHLRSWARWEGKVIAVGAIDSRTSAPDDLEWAERAVGDIATATRPKELLVTTNEQLFYTCTDTVAEQKLRALGELARRVG